MSLKERRTQVRDGLAKIASLSIDARSRAIAERLVVSLTKGIAISDDEEALNEAFNAAIKRNAMTEAREINEALHVLRGAV